MSDTTWEEDSGLLSLILLAKFYQLPADPISLGHEFKIPGENMGVDDILRASKKIGLKAKALTYEPENLLSLPLPAIAKHKDNHFIILAKKENKGFLIHDPLARKQFFFSLEDVHHALDKDVILFALADNGSEKKRKFDFTWFIPSIVKYRYLLLDVMIMAFCVQVLSLLVPFFFQVVIDKVIVHQGLSTLNVILFGLSGIYVFEFMLNLLRQYILSHTSSRIDVELGSELFRHLLKLPLSYFQTRRVGESVSRMRELENIRQFITGKGITAIFDVVFSALFIIVMGLYSFKLMLIVALSIPIYLMITLLLNPFIQQRLNDKFERSAENQNLLIEVINGIQTIKSMAIEPQLQRRWDHHLADYVKATFKSSVMTFLGQESITFMTKIFSLVTLFFAAKLVISEQLSMGQFIAFNMFSNRIAAPIIRLSNLWLEFQQTGIAVKRLSELADVPIEALPLTHTHLPQMRGEIHFEQVLFRYQQEGKPAIDHVSFHIKPNEIIGILGHSGSGKSTLIRLIQRFVLPEKGKILIDGVDISVLDLIWLRRQISVVQQETYLFQGSIRDNIALIDPSVSLDNIIHVATLTGAHAFISELPRGYDTLLGEHGYNLSGGQRQRIAITRALMSNPRVLIFDEATSALDLDAEAYIQDNMPAICRDRTVIIITHRLSSVKQVDRLLILESGALIHSGKHEALMDQSEIYARWSACTPS